MTYSMQSLLVVIYKMFIRIPDTIVDHCHHIQQPEETRQKALHPYKEKKDASNLTIKSRGLHNFQFPLFDPVQYDPA